MNRAQKLIQQIKHCSEFLKILEQASPDKMIRVLTHENPLLVFWVTPTGEVLDAKDAHFQNPPSGDRSILATPGHKGHLRGRSALIGTQIYIVIYGDEVDHSLSRRQFALLRRTYPKILGELAARGNKNVADANFITEDGEDILL